MSHGFPISLRVLSLAVAGYLATCAWAARPAAGRQGPDGPGPGLVHESWTVKDGLPLNSIRALAQSRDGHIWLVTMDGLVRFDGVRFTISNTANTPTLPTNRLVSLIEDTDANLWMRSETGDLVRFRRGRFTRFGPGQGLAGQVRDLMPDPQGGV